MSNRGAVGLFAALGLALGCRTPAPTPKPIPALPLRHTPKPQYTWSTWSHTLPLIRQGRVLQVVTGKGHTSLILDDHTWVRLLSDPTDPLPPNPFDYIVKHAPNGHAIRHTIE